MSRYFFPSNSKKSVTVFSHGPSGMACSRSGYHLLHGFVAKQVGHLRTKSSISASISGQ